jgi:hypothetical protein
MAFDTATGRLEVHRLDFWLCLSGFIAASDPAI